MILRPESEVKDARLKPSGRKMKFPFLSSRGSPATRIMAQLFCHSCSQGSPAAAEAMACPLCGSDFIEFVQPQVQTHITCSMTIGHILSPFMKVPITIARFEELMMWHAGAPACSSTADSGTHEAAGRSQWSAAQAVHNARPELERSPDDDACRSGTRGARRFQLPHGITVRPGAAWRRSRVSALSWGMQLAHASCARLVVAADAERGFCCSCQGCGAVLQGSKVVVDVCGQVHHLRQSASQGF